VRILIDTTYTARGPTGTGVYVERLIVALRDAGVVVITARNRLRRAPGGGPMPSIVNYLVDRLWTAVALPWIAWRRGVDLIHHPLPALAPLAPCPQGITVHDLAFVRRPDLFDPRYARWARHSHRAAARGAGAVICVSEATRHDVVELWRVARERTVVAHHGAGQLEGVNVVRSDSPRWFLYVGDEEPRKNVGVLLDAYRRYRRGGGEAPLLLAGTVEPPLDPDIEVVVRPGAGQLARLYADAIALVHPAIEEGFGLTLVEAMAAGTPVLAAGSRAAVEICSDAAWLLALDPGGFAESFADAMARLERDPQLRDRLSKAGHDRSAEFSWACSARAHIEAYTLALR
jgi:glycosyltransferase involved in cell wall biosynthesis